LLGREGALVMDGDLKRPSFTGKQEGRQERRVVRD